MSKDKVETKVKDECKHHYVVTAWSTKGGYQSAAAMRCSYCLIPACLEQLESWEWSQKQEI